MTSLNPMLSISDKRMDKRTSKEIRKVEKSRRAVKGVLRAFNPHNEQVNLLILKDHLSENSISLREQNKEVIL